MTLNPEALNALFTEVGAALNAWGNVESSLALLFYEAGGIRPYEKSNSIFDAIVNFDARLTVCDVAMASDETDLTDLERVMWCKLSGRLRKFYKRRHEIAHFQVPSHHHGDQPWGDRLIPYFTWGKENAQQVRYLSGKQIEMRRHRFEGLASAVLWFGLHMRIKRTGNPIDDVGPEEPPLITHIRALASRNPEER